MTRAALFSAFVFAAALPVAHAQVERPAAEPVLAAPTATSPASPSARKRRGQPAEATPPVAPAPAKVEAAAYYPPPGSLQAPLTAADVCRSLRGGLSGPEVAQDVRERGLIGAFGDDEAADARAAGAAPEFIAALQAGRFTVSSAYARRSSEQAAKDRQAVGASAWRAEAAAQAQAADREGELRRQGQIAAENNRAIAAKERGDKQRWEDMKARADWESRQRAANNANDGYLSNGVWYSHRSGSRGHYYYY